MINKSGELIDHMIAAVQSHGATPDTDVRVRIGKTGPEYRIHELVGSTDNNGRDFKLILQTSIAPTGQ